MLNIDYRGVFLWINIQQSGPGTYEAKFPVDQDGTFSFSVIGDEAGPERTLPYSYPDEYHFYPPDVDLLEEVAYITGGQYQPTAQDIFTTEKESTTRPIQLWPYLSFAALLLYLTDLFLRRIRLFEKQSVVQGNKTSTRRSGRTLHIS